MRLNPWRLFFAAIGGLTLVAAIAVVGVIGIAIAKIYPSLPEVTELSHYKPKIPLRIYSAEGDLIGEFGEERRDFVEIGAVPSQMKQAILAAEDERFYEHPGIDVRGIARALLANLRSGGRQGASTITMQVARNFFLTKEQTMQRKAAEALLALKIEREFSKDKILELYVNHIYLGQRAYGFEAAARTYFGKKMSELTLAETAMLAGLPKAPSTYNPVANPKRAKQRQLYVLERMERIGFVGKQASQIAKAEKLSVRQEKKPIMPLAAEHAAEMARAALAGQLSEGDLYGGGYRVETTIRKDRQEAANRALREGLLAYDERHGYRGPERRITLPKDVGDLEKLLAVEFESGILAPIGNLDAAVVMDSGSKDLSIRLSMGRQGKIDRQGMSIAKNWSRSNRFAAGDVIRVKLDGKGAWRLAQLPQAEAAFVAIDPNSGEIMALTGGFDFQKSRFNRVTQANRQPGSSLKPFIYSAALERGLTPATLLEDEPILMPDPAKPEEDAWEPGNYGLGFSGLTRMRSALARSLNMVSIRILKIIGPEYARDHLAKFGIDPSGHPPYLTMALGAGASTPLELARGYAVFANGGFRIDPYLIARVYDGSGALVYESNPRKARAGAPRAIGEGNAFLIANMLRDVVRSGTAAQAKSLGRDDIAGKTGTTNDHKDAWFAGFSPDVAAVAWIGFDQPKPLGDDETGGSAALPIWMSFMASETVERQKRKWDEAFPKPEGVILAKVSKETGKPISDEAEGGIWEYFLEEFPPAEEDLFLGSIPQPKSPDLSQEEVMGQLGADGIAQEFPPLGGSPKMEQPSPAGTEESRSIF